MNRKGSSMKLAIFGAAGRTGIPLVQQALEEGHEVVALVRTPAKLSIGDERLTVVQGDVAHLADVERVVQGADAVLSVRPSMQIQLDHIAGRERRLAGAWSRRVHRQRLPAFCPPGFSSGLLDELPPQRGKGSPLVLLEPRGSRRERV